MKSVTMNAECGSFADGAPCADRVLIQEVIRDELFEVSEWRQAWNIDEGWEWDDGGKIDLDQLAASGALWMIPPAGWQIVEELEGVDNA